MSKLSYCLGGEWIEHSYAPAFSVAETAGGRDRLTAGVPPDGTIAFERLILALRAPYMLLYVLHTPRGEADAGRYQSPELSAVQLREFLQRFGPFLLADARFDLWAYSPAERATVVWDRHNQLFAYGPLTRFAEELSSLGFAEREWPSVVSVPHQHHYRSEYDGDARALLSWCEWTYSPLRPEDEQ